jgi:hypothetical protein
MRKPEQPVLPREVLASFIKQLGYPARRHTPGMDYDLIVPPLAVIITGVGLWRVVRIGKKQ